MQTTLRNIMNYVYLLQSLKDKKFYVGYTSDLKQRFKAHQSGEVTSTKTKRPFALVFYEAFRSKQDALRRERYFKTTKGKATLRMMIRHSFLS